MAEMKPQCSECQSESEHDCKLKIAEIDRNIYNQINLLNKPPEGYGDDPVPISLSDYSDSESEDDQNIPSCECLSEISYEERELFNLPPEYVVGEAVPDANCFFDSFRQGLKTLSQVSITIADLRTICAEVANKSPLWLLNTLPSGVTLAEFTKRTLLADSWGYIELHGWILCQHFNVHLYVLEENNGIMHSLVTDSGVRCVSDVSFGCPNSIYIINRGRNHFKPLLRISPEFENVLRAIKAGDVPRLEAALGDHRSVLYYSGAERQLEQCSLQDAIQSYNIRIVDLLYEHWAGAAFAAHAPHFHNLQRLGHALVKARDSCLSLLDRDQQMVIDVHCIIEFNKFEVKLYRELNDYPVSKSNDRKQRLLRMVDILITTIDLYELYSDKNIRATKNEVVDILRLQPLFNDKSTIYQKYMHYAMYELYYRKLDFCVSKLILEYVHSLKEKLKLPENVYQTIECSLYYFLYRVNEEWRLYMPENRPKGKKHAFLFDIDRDFSHVRDDDCRLFSGPVIYFEWLKFRKSLRNFKEALKSTSVADNFRKKGDKLPAEEINSLTLLPYLRDEHSLRKVVHYLEQAKRAIQRLPPVEAALVVQRVLQVTGECLKSTDKSLHLSSTTSALLQVYIPVVTLKHLHTLRNDFSKLRDGKLIRRINIEETNPVIYSDVTEDLKWVKKAIIEVRALCKPMLEKYLLDEGLQLVKDRVNEFPMLFGYFGSAINEIQKYLHYGHGMFTKLEDNMIKRISESQDVNVTRQFVRELGSLYKNIEILYSEMYERNVLIISYVQTLLQPVYSVVQNIETQINEWISIKKELERLQLKVGLPNYPNDTLKLIVEEVKTIKCQNQKPILKQLSSIKEYSSEWCVIKTILEYIVVKMDLFRNNHYEIKGNCFTNMLKSIVNGQPNATGINKVKTLLSSIEHEVQNNWKIKQFPISKDLLAYKYEAIKQLNEYMSKNKFITNKEMEYLKDQLNSDDISHPIMEKILSGREITTTERNAMYANTKAIDEKERCKAIIENLVIGSKRDGCALQCLAQRAVLLRDAITGEDAPRLVQRYYQDEVFRILIESLLADIYNIHFERNLSNLLDNNMRLLAEYPMRNIFEHGNPLLEVIGKMLDSSDFPGTLFRCALRVVEDEPALAELSRLYEQGVKREQAEREWSGPHTPRYQHYFKLLPSELGQHANVSQSSDRNTQNNPETDIKINDHPQVANRQIDDKHTDTKIPKKKGKNKQKPVKDEKILIHCTGTIYCIKYSKDEEKKVRSFLNKLRKKGEQSASKLKTEQKTLEMGANVDTRTIGKDKTKSNVKESKNAGTSKTKAHREEIRKKITNLLNMSESSNKLEKASETTPLGLSDEKMIRFSIKVDESSLIQMCKREESHIKIPKYFLFTCLEIFG